MDLKDLTPEQMEKAKACKTIEELSAFAQAEGLELSEEQLEGIAGGHNSLCDCVVQVVQCRGKH